MADGRRTAATLATMAATTSGPPPNRRARPTLPRPACHGPALLLSPADCHECTDADFYEFTGRQAGFAPRAGVLTLWRRLYRSGIETRLTAPG